ncbi:MAG TPA: hypothetical protein VD994_14985 [Prosthecobacter sp.]|nr:hypothetical protein [Prosthecobacter sp.]
MVTTVSYGAFNTSTREVPAGTTIGALRADRNLKAVLGYGDNVDFTVDGVAQPDSTVLHDGDKVSVVTKAACKA